MSFSIVTPSFRQPEWLRLCLASVADQAAGAHGADDRPGADAAVTVDHVVQDACSGEAVRAVCAEFPNVRLFQERDAGMYDAVNRGLRRGTGDICAYLNCDEQYLPGTLAAVQSYFRQHPEVDLLFGDVVVVDPAGHYVCSRPCPDSAQAPYAGLPLEHIYRRDVLPSPGSRRPDRILRHEMEELRRRGLGLDDA
jgi:glycosyltransferase involved in cell wall biosynthesis